MRHLSSALLLCLLGVLVGTLAAELGLISPQSQKTSGPAAEQAQKDVNPLTASFELPPVAALTETITRPLFAPERRAPEPGSTSELAAEAVDSTSSSPDGFKLSSVVIAGEERFAFIRAPALPDAERFSVGDSIEGWTLAEIHPDKVILHQGQRRGEVQLRTFTAPPRPAAKRSVTAASKRSSARRSGRTSSRGQKTAQSTSDQESTPGPVRPRRPQQRHRP